MKKFMFIHKLNFSMFSLFVLYISITVFAVHAEIHHNTLTVDATDRENWVIRQHIYEIGINALNRG